MRTLLALCREVAVNWWRELPPLVRSRQFLLTTMLLACVGLLMAFTQVVRGGHGPVGSGARYASVVEPAPVAMQPRSRQAA